MIEDLKLILNTEFDVIKADGELVIKFLKLYQLLFNETPKMCESCHRQYYYLLKTKGMDKAEMLKELENRTCVPRIGGLKYFPVLAKHVDDDHLTDKEAIKLLKAGYLKESDFKTLPKGYKTTLKKKATPKTEDNSEVKTEDTKK